MPIRTILLSKSHLLLAIIFLGMVFSLFLHLTNLQQNLVLEASLQHAASYSRAISEFRRTYTTEVISRISGVAIKHDYHSSPNAIPLPATLSMIVGEKISEAVEGETIRLYSPYPFPWRQNRPEQKDPFLQNAWTALNQNSNLPYHELKNSHKGQVLRYAVSDVMDASCVPCHNSHPDSPKRDWQAGQVRGILEISLPMEALRDTANNSLMKTAVFYVFIAILVFSLLVFIGTHQHQNSLRLENLIRKRTHELEVAKDEAVYANATKSEFLSKMSHELRTPMNAIMGFSQLLEHENLTSEQHSSVQEIHSAGENMLLLIDELLGYSNLENGNISFSLEPVDLEKIIKDILHILQAKAKKKNITTSEQYKRGIKVLCDPSKVRQILFNVIRNGIDYNTAGGKLLIETKVLSDERARISVTDTGKGIDRKLMKNLFVPFDRLGAELSNVGGAGVGLAVSKRMAEMMNIALWAESEPGTGTTVHIDIPIANQ